MEAVFDTYGTAAAEDSFCLIFAKVIVDPPFKQGCYEQTVAENLTCSCHYMHGMNEVHD